MTVKEKVKYGLCVEDQEDTTNRGLGVRHVQVLCMFVCLSVVYVMRINMSVAIIAMTDVEHPTPGVAVYDWDKKIQDLILSSFFWGYTLTQIPAGQLAHKYGVKPLVFLSMLINGLTSLAFPWAVNIGGWKAACFCRVLQGLTQSCFFPCINTFISVWVPHSERSRLSNFMYTGTPIGTISGLLLSSVLSGSAIGWPAIFYAIGAFAVFVSFLWLWLGASSPATHKSISDKERFYIQSTLGQIKQTKPPKIPWKSIITSMPMYALLVAHIGCNWGFITLFAEIPSYMNSVLHINTKNSGILTILPYTAMWIGSIIFSFISDYIVNNKICTPTVSRKIFNTIGSWAPALGLIVLSFLPAGHEKWAICILTLTVGISSGMNMGYMMNHVDLAPNFAGTLFATTNCIANLFGSLAPMAVGFILVDHSDPVQWRIVFFISAAFYFLSNLFFIISGTSKRQPWNEPQVKTIEMVGIKIAVKQERQEMLSKPQTN